MNRRVVRAVVLMAVAGMSLGGLQTASWATSEPKPVSCELTANASLPHCIGDVTFDPNDGDEPRPEDGGEGPKTEQGCYDEYGYWDEACTVVIDDPIVDPVETCDVAVVTGDDGVDTKMMTCRDEQGNVVRTVTYNADGCRVTTDAEGNAETECPGPWQQNAFPTCESTETTLDDGTVAFSTVCVDENGTVVYKSYTEGGCTTWTDAEGNSEKRCEPVCDTQTSTLEDGTSTSTTVCVDENGNVVYKAYTAGTCITWTYPDGTEETACSQDGGAGCEVDDEGMTICRDAGNLGDDLVYATSGSRGDNCTVCRGGVVEKKPVVAKPAKKPAKKSLTSRGKPAPKRDAVASKGKSSTVAAKKPAAASKRVAASKATAKKPVKKAAATTTKNEKSKVTAKKPVKKPAKKIGKKSTKR